MEEPQELTEDALVAMKLKFSNEIDSLEQALSGVKGEGGCEDVVNEIAAAVEKSREVLKELDETLFGYRDVMRTGRAFTEKEMESLRYFGFDIRVSVSAKSPSVAATETETNVYDAYKIRPSPELLDEPVVGSIKDKIKYEVAIHTEVENRLGSLLSTAGQEMQSRSEAMFEEKLRQLDSVVDAKVLKALSATNRAASPSRSIHVTESCTQTTDDVVDLFGIDSPDLLEARINDLVSERVRIERQAAKDTSLTLSPYRTENDLQDDLDAAHTTLATLQTENAHLKEKLRNKKHAADNNELAGAVRKLNSLSEELDSVARERQAAVRNESRHSDESRKRTLEKLEEIMSISNQSTRDEVTALREALKSTREMYKREISSLGGRLETVVSEGTHHSLLIDAATQALNETIEELTEKTYEYNPPIDTRHRDPAEVLLDEAVARTLSSINCPVPIDCHKIGSSEYFLDRKVQVKLVNELVYVQRHNGKGFEKLSSYIRNLYAPFIHNLDLRNVAGLTEVPRVLDLEDELPLDEDELAELEKLQKQQRELVSQLGGGGGGGGGVSNNNAGLLYEERSNTPGAHRIPTPARSVSGSSNQAGGYSQTQSYSSKYSQQQQQQRRRSSSGVKREPSPPPASYFSDVERDLLRQLFDLTDKNMVGLVNRQQLLRSLKRYPEVAMQLRTFWFPQDLALETFITSIPGPPDREFTWESLLMLFADGQLGRFIQEPEYPAQEQHPQKDRGPGSDPARVFNEKIQARQREMTKELLEGRQVNKRTYPAPKPKKGKHPSRSPSASKTKLSSHPSYTDPLPPEKVNVLKAQALRQQISDMRKRQSQGW